MSNYWIVSDIDTGYKVWVADRQEAEKFFQKCVGFNHEVELDIGDENDFVLGEENPNLRFVKRYWKNLHTDQFYAVVSTAYARVAQQVRVLP